MKPWPNGTPNSSQLARNHSIVWIRPLRHITITTQLGDGWLEFGWGGQTVTNLARVGRKFELDPTPANSSQVGGQTILNSIEVVNLAQVALSWEDRLARALANKVCVCLHRTLQCSEACGGGLRHRNLSCQQQDEQGTLFPVAAMACAHAPKLETEELCNEDVLCSGLLLLH